MDETEAVLTVVDALESLELPYIMVGAFSVNAYALPRATMDADFLIELGPGALQALQTELAGKVEFEPQIRFETVTGKTRYVLHPVGSKYLIDLFEMTEDGHDRSRMARRRRIDFHGRPVAMPTAEDVLITKLRWCLRAGRTKDRLDIENLLDARSADMDWPYVNEWADRHGTRALLEQLRRGAPPID